VRTPRRFRHRAEGTGCLGPALFTVVPERAEDNQQVGYIGVAIVIGITIARWRRLTAKTAQQDQDVNNVDKSIPVQVTGALARVVTRFFEEYGVFNHKVSVPGGSAPGAGHARWIEAAPTATATAAEGTGSEAVGSATSTTEVPSTATTAGTDIVARINTAGTAGTKRAR
jgi:hypothetical protein